MADVREVVPCAAIVEPASIAFDEERNRCSAQQPAPLGNIGAQPIDSCVVDREQALLAKLAAADVDETVIEVDVASIEAQRLVDPDPDRACQRPTGPPRSRTHALDRHGLKNTGYPVGVPEADITDFPQFCSLAEGGSKILSG